MIYLLWHKGGSTSHDISINKVCVQKSIKLYRGQSYENLTVIIYNKFSLNCNSVIKFTFLRSVIATVFNYFKAPKSSLQPYWIILKPLKSRPCGALVYSNKYPSLLLFNALEDTVSHNGYSRGLNILSTLPGKSIAPATLCITAWLDRYSFSCYSGVA